jgi:hypothetical protein
MVGRRWVCDGAGLPRLEEDSMELEGPREAMEGNRGIGRRINTRRMARTTSQVAFCPCDVFSLVTSQRFFDQPGLRGKEVGVCKE